VVRRAFVYHLAVGSQASKTAGQRAVDGARLQGVVLVEGTLPSGETALVVWRDCDKADNAALAEILKAQGYLSKADEKPLKDVGTIFVNGDHALPPVLSGETGETKVRQIEEVFLSKMWEER